MVKSGLKEAPGSQDVPRVSPTDWPHTWEQPWSLHFNAVHLTRVAVPSTTTGQGCVCVVFTHMT